MVPVCHSPQLNGAGDPKGFSELSLPSPPPPPHPRGSRTELALLCSYKSQQTLFQPPNQVLGGVGAGVAGKGVWGVKVMVLPATILQSA